MQREWEEWIACIKKHAPTNKYLSICLHRGEALHNYTQTHKNNKRTHTSTSSIEPSTPTRKRAIFSVSGSMFNAGLDPLRTYSYNNEFNRGERVQ